ncbi:hypothetical protein [Streptomyces diastatochromogenes]|uniref:Uncharacterized protein n=1 Tax=Streptomyces diastatochromogenes TaxID=42236 RepID=A0A233SPU8_STRDA|nr:hypothetical protein [Streptomyces diastatochromogenes]MCZ0987963.1 hypothetical protein [Streptomyces diastatochromogenes]OXY97673.1 hypothetical protein BEK98_08975 [Streptomyces diastatochromogenes]
MRRTAAVASAVTVLVPLLLAGASTASAAATGSLTVRTLDRSGKAVYAQVAVYNTKTYDFRYIEGNKKASLPNGSYELATSFVGGNSEDAVVGGHSVQVSGATTTTFDGRKGRAVKVSLSPAPGSGYDHTVSAAVCASDNSPATMSISADSGDLYAIPNSSSAYELSYGTTYQPRSTTGGDFWLASATHTRGVPSGVSATLKKSGLTTLKVSARSGPDSGQARFSFNGGSTGGDDCSSSMNILDFQRDLPNSFGVHVPAGQWEVMQDSHDLIYDGFHKYAAGKTTSLSLGHAVWGPGGKLPYTWYHQLYFGGDNPFADPKFTGGGVLASGTLKLTHAGKTLYKHDFTPSTELDPHPRIPGSGWYMLTETAHRTGLPSGSLSTSSSLSLHFYADAGKNQQIRDYITRFWPEALNSRNQAAAGSTTTVDLGMQRLGTGDSTIGRLSDSVKSVRAWYTTDNGAHWNATTAKLSGGKWTIAVHNPTSGPGRVGLRSTVTDTHGDSSTTTVYNAYAVS